MPQRAPSLCAFPGCGRKVHGTHCAQHAKQYDRDRDKGRACATRRGYGYGWQKLRRMQLTRQPLCVECQRNGLTTWATTVDHITPHRGDRALFFDTHNLQSLCKRCHDRKTGRGE